MPGVGDEVVIPDRPGSVTINYSSGSTSVQSISSAETLNVSGGTLTVTGAITGSGSVSLAGGTLAGATVNPILIVTSLGGTLDGVTLNGDLDVTTRNAWANVQNGLTLNGVATLGEYARLYFLGTQTLGGTGSVVFQNWYANALIAYTNGMTLTIGPGITVRGGGNGSYSAKIGGDAYWGSGANTSIINQGTISADTVGLSLYVLPQDSGTFLNTGTLSTSGGGLFIGGNYTRAALGTLSRSSGALYIAGALDLTGVTETLTSANQSWYLGGGTIKNGTINATGGAKLYVTDWGGTLDGVTLNGDLDVTTRNAWANVQNGLTLNGVATLGEYARLYFLGTQTLGGTGSVVFQNWYANALIAYTNGMTLTIGPGITVRGGGNGSYSAKIGGDAYWGSGANTSILNQGTITADTPGMSLYVLPQGAGTFTNTGTLDTSGGSLFVGGNYTRAALGTLSRSSGSLYIGGALDLTGVTETLTGANQSWYLGGGTIKNGTINATGGAKLYVTDWGGTLDSLTLNGDLDVTTRDAWANVQNGLTLNGTATLGEYARLGFLGTQTLGGTGTVVFQNWYANALITSTNNMTLTLGPGLTIRGGGNGGYSARIGGNAYWVSATNGSIVNQGTITADAAGMTIAIYPRGTGAFTNFGTLDVNAGNLLIGGPAIIDAASILRMSSSGQLNVSGSLNLQVPNPSVSNLRGSVRLSANGTAGSPQLLEVVSQDLGSGLAGYTNNTVLGSLVLGSSNYVKLVDVVDNSPGTPAEALYTNSLVVPSGSTLDLNGLKLYTRAAQIDGTIVGGTLMQLPDSGALTVGLVTPGKIAVGGELDEWTFFGRAGRTIALTVNPGSQASDGAPPPISPLLGYVNVAIVGPNNSVLASANATNNNQVLSLSNITLPSDGVYRIRVKAATGQSSRTGNYNLGVYDVTVDDARLLLNRPTVGQLTPSFNTDRWHFAVAEGRQIRFDLLGSTATGIKFTLQGPSGYIPFTDITDDSDLITIPAGKGGEYTLIVKASSDQTASYSFAVRETTVRDLAMNTTYNGTLAGAADSQLFKVTTTAAKPLFVALDDAVNTHRNQLYLKFGAPPTRGDYDFRYDGSPTADPQLLSSHAAAGVWYVLVYGDYVPSASSFTLRATSSDVHISRVTPDQYGANANVPVTINGAGFVTGTQVKLIGPGAQEFLSADLTVDSYSQVSATFNLAAAAAGQYSVEVRHPSGDSDTAVNVFTVTPPGQAKLETRLIMPPSLGRHAVATIYLEYANTGNAAMPAPLLVLQSGDVDGSDLPILTLDQSRIIQNYWSDGLPPGTSNSVLLLGSGAQPGILNPGERIQVPVYYLGLQQPWDFSDSQVELEVRYWTTADTTPIDWSAAKNGLRPATFSATQWDAVYGNLTSDIATKGQYIQMLSDNAVYLSKLGEQVTNVDDLWSFEVQQAFGFGAVSTLDAVTDAALPTPGIALDFSRRFSNSLVARNSSGPFGQGWFTAWQTRLVAEAGGELVRIVGEGGSARLFQRDSRNGKYFSGVGDSSELVAIGGGIYELRDLGGTVTRFRADGKIDYVRDANNNRVTASYDGSGRLSGLAHTSGASLAIAYNAAGLIGSIADSAGRTTTYTYDATNTWLTTVTAPDGKTAQYAYQTNGAAAVKNALLSIDRGGTTQFFTYDSRGRLDSSYRTGNANFVDYGYDSTGRVTASDNLGTTTLFFDYRGLLVKTTSALGNTTVNEFDANLNLNKVIAPTGETQSFTWSKRGQLTSTTNELGQTTSFAYAGPLNNLSSFVDAKGNKTSYTYDAQGNLLMTVYANGTQEVLGSYSPNGLPQQYANRRGQASSYTYNTQGRVVRQTFADSTFIDYEHDARGNLTKSIDGADVTTYVYDYGVDGDRLKQVNYPGGKYLAYAYDAFGRRIRMTDQDGFATKYEYDAAGRLYRLRDAADAIIVTYSYDAAGRLLRIDKGNDTFTTYEYDAAGKLTSLKNWREIGTLNSKFDYTYNSRGQRTSMTTLDGAWTYTYDGAGQLTRAVFASLNSGLIPNQDLNYVYDAAGNRIRTILNGVTTEYQTNNLNQYTSVGGLAQTYDADGNLTFDGMNTYVYDQQNRLVQISGPSGIKEYDYDAIGQARAVRENGIVTNRVYDSVGGGAPVTESDGGGTAVAHTFTGIGVTARATGATNYWMDFDSSGAATGVTGPAGTVVNSYAYAPFGTTLTSTSAVANPYAFGGQLGVVSAGQGFIDTVGGYYNASLGRLASSPAFSTALDNVGIGLALGSAAAEGAAAFWKSQALIVAKYAALEDVYLETVFDWTKTANVSSDISRKYFGGASIAFDLLQGITPEGIDWIGTTLDTIAILPKSASIFGIASTEYTLLKSAYDRWGRAIIFPKLLSWDDAHPALGDALLRLRDLFHAGIGTFLSDIGIANAIDPNDKFGAEGFGPQAFITADTAIPYRIRFENLGPGSKDHDGNPYPTFATAPAQRVAVSDQLSADLDWNTFQITELGWGDFIVGVPPGSSYYSGTQSMAYNGKVFDVELEAGIDLATGRVSISFQSLDPTWDLPPDVLTGFLPPEDGTGRGMGHVLFTVRPRTGLASGTQIRNVALIGFDDQTIIATNQIDPQDASRGTDPSREALNTIDASPPTSSVAALPASIGNTSIPVTWAGGDGAGSGIAAYNVYVRVDGGAWALWLDHTTNTSANYSGVMGSTYAFYSVAFDNVGYAEQAPATADATTTLVENAWHNFVRPEDVDSINGVTIQDATAIIRDLRRSGARSVSGQTPTGLYLDVNNDGRVDVQDAINVIRYLRRHPVGGGEGESTENPGLPSLLRSPALAADLVFLSWSASKDRRKDTDVDSFN